MAENSTPYPMNTKLGGDALQEGIQAYHRACEEEFNLTENPELEDPKELADKAREKLVQLVPEAVRALSDLLGSPKPETKLSAAKFIIKTVFEKKLTTDGEESLAEMFEKLQKHPAAEEKVAVKVPQTRSKE